MVVQFDRQAVAGSQLAAPQDQSYGHSDGVPAIDGLEAFRWFAIA